MAAVVVDGKELAKDIRSAVGKAAAEITPIIGREPGLAVILVGDNPASAVYVASKSKAARECGIRPIDFRLPAQCTQQQLFAVIDEANSRDDVDGILLQLPLPKGLDEASALLRISAHKDADGLHPHNQGQLLRSGPGFRPCTPLGVMRLIDRAMELLGRPRDLSGLKAAVVGRSVLVGKPAALLLLERHCSVAMFHSRTRNLAEECAQADILVAAIGRPEMIDGAFIKPGAVVVDVGINRLESGKLVGDVHFESALEKAGAVTPVPGGVGPLTITMLLSNTVDAARQRRNR